MHVNSEDGAHHSELARLCLQPSLASLLAGIGEAADGAEGGCMPVQVTADASAEELTKGGAGTPANSVAALCARHRQAPEHRHKPGLLAQRHVVEQHAGGERLPGIYVSRRDKANYMHVRKDIHAALQTLLSEPGVNPRCP